MSKPDRAPPSLQLALCLGAVYVIWSSTYLVMRYAIEALPPLLMAALRYGVAGTVMLAWGRLRLGAWPAAREWIAVLPVGVLLFVGGNGFVAIAEGTVSSGGAAVVCATMPLWVGVLGIVAGEPPTRREWLVLALGFGGVLVLMGGPSLQGRPLHIAILLAAPVCWALGSILARKLTGPSARDAVMLSGMEMLAGAAGLLVGGLVRGEHFPPSAPMRAWLALAYLCVAGSLVAFPAYAWLLRNARAVVATSYAYVNPTLAVLLGAAVAHERLGLTTLVANLLIVAAVVLALRRPRGAA